MAVSKPNIVNLIGQVPAGNFGVGRRSPISQISEHHVVGDASGAISKAKTPGKEFSCTFTIAMDGTIYQLVEIKNTPYTDNDYRSNGRAITIEHAGGHPQYPYTEAMYQSSIKLHAWLFQEYGLGPGSCVRHRDIPEIKADPSKATACCGDLDVERIKREAANLIGGKGAGGDEVMNENGAKGLYRLGLHREPENDQVWRGWLGKPADQGMEAFRGSPEWLSQNHVLLVAYPQAQETIRQLQEQLKTASEKPPEVVIKEVEKIVEKCDLPDVVKPEPIEPKAPNWLARLLAALSRKK